MKVKTFQFAYVKGSVTLCEEHEKSWNGYILGPVSHGRHEGTCFECDCERAYQERIKIVKGTK